MTANLKYFSLLGVSENASQDEVEARYRELSEFLSSPAVPSDLKQWAEQQNDLLQEAYAELLDPELRTSARDEPATFESPAAAPVAPKRRAAPVAGTAPDRSALGKLVRHPLFIGLVVGLAVVGAVFVGKSGMPGTDGGKSSGGEEVAANSLDQARIAQLMATIQRDPQNLEALFELGESYFTANQWQMAIDWFTKVVAIDPKNVHAYTDIGTSNFNLGRPAEAKAAWQHGVELAPDDPQLHYNLGFWFANTEPADYAAARTEWQKVVALAPDSNLAKTVQVHLSGLPAN